MVCSGVISVKVNQRSEATHGLGLYVMPVELVTQIVYDCTKTAMAREQAFSQVVENQSVELWNTTCPILNRMDSRTQH